jgi:hypothetical protein
MTSTGLFGVIAHDQTGDERRARRRQRRQERRSMAVQTDAATSGPRTLLVFDRRGSEQLTTRINRRWARLIARVLAPGLDRRLAQGRSPESSLLLATRAQLLVSPVMRLTLAQRWESLVVQARTPPVPRDPRVPVNRDAILACQSDLRDVVDAVLAPLPTPARGLARASWLLSDGTGPLYRRCPPVELSAALRETTAQLDPSLSL